MSTGFHWFGLIRALQGEIVIFLAFVFLSFIVAKIIKFVINKSLEAGDIEDEQAKKGREWVSKGFIIILLLVTLVLGWRFANYMLANRVPRADVDKSSVYEKMDSIR